MKKIFTLLLLIILPALSFYAQNSLSSQYSFSLYVLNEGLFFSLIAFIVVCNIQFYLSEFRKNKIYLFNLIDNGFSDNKKMVLTKSLQIS
jgi:hypothetical protein